MCRHIKDGVLKKGKAAEIRDEYSEILERSLALENPEIKVVFGQ
jgi:hypothetical protein